jgi:hypothetical protein
MRTTIAEVISQLRSRLKLIKQDAFVTDRFLYGILVKHSKVLMKREDGQNKLMKFNSVFQTLDFVELEEIDKVDACCAGIKSGITIRRSILPLPAFAQGYWGPLIRDVTSIDGSEELQPTNPGSYAMYSRSTNFKYNKNKYYWYLNDHLYFPNLDWDAVRIEGIFQDDISAFTCKDQCLQRQNLSFNVPDYLHTEIEDLAMKDLVVLPQIPSDNTNDKQSPVR